MIMSNSYPEFPVSFARRRALFGDDPSACSIPVINQSAARYSNESRKPHLIQAGRGLDWNLKPWRTSYQDEFIQHKQCPSSGRHIFSENPSDEYAAHPNSITQNPLWSHPKGFLGCTTKKAIRAAYQGSGIPGLDTKSCLNIIPWQDKKEIVGVDPREIILKRSDIRHIRKYRASYLDRDLLEDGRNDHKLQPPSTLPPLTAKIINNIMVSHNPYSDCRIRDKAVCSYLV